MANARNARNGTRWWFGEGFAKLAERLSPGSHVFVQGELQTREYECTIQVPNGKKTIDHKIQQLAVEISAEIIRILDRSPRPSPVKRKRKTWRPLTRGLRPCQKVSIRECGGFTLAPLSYRR
jgi:hypothetical protein